MPFIKTIIFDLDDTLIETGDLFRHALDCMYQRIKKVLGPATPSDDDVYALQNEIDMKLMGRSGVKPERFSESLIQTYREVVLANGGATTESDEEYLHAEGLRAFQDTPEFSEGALDVLDHYKDRELLLYTWGRQEVQSRRIDALNIRDRFAEIHIVEEKNASVLEGVLRDRDKDETVLCGDSLRNEIAPSVEVGIHAVHMVREDGWAFLQADIDPGAHYHKIKKLPELLPIISKLDA